MSDLRRVLEKKMKERREFVERFGGAGARPTSRPTIDYRRKRGMLEEINRAAREVETEEDELDADPPATAAGRVGADRAARSGRATAGRRAVAAGGAARAGAGAAAGATPPARRRSQ